jgi:hypothetical protein
LLRQRLTGETESIIARDPRDEKDYSRPVLGVMPDCCSLSSSAVLT